MITKENYPKGCFDEFNKTIKSELDKKTEPAPALTQGNMPSVRGDNLNKRENDK
tara:strand:- start:21720 stop:21881 length:162 start_codon:yes stop_codon:yes gene_type:complete